jgi:hypothetical protein
LKWKAQISKGILVRWFDKVKATSNIVTEEKRERNSNEARTTGSLFEKVRTACAYAASCGVLARKDDVSLEELDLTCVKSERSRGEGRGSLRHL